jgi:outer membrane immunogenic protein
MAAAPRLWRLTNFNACEGNHSKRHSMLRRHNTLRKLLLSAAAIAALAGSAFAADLPSTKSAPIFVAPVSVYDWTGFYVGADVGGVWGQGKLTAGTYTSTVHTSSVLGGGFGGYNYQINKFIVGLQGGIDGMGATATNSVGIGMRETYLASVDARLGYACDRILVYAIGGGAFTNTTHWGSSTNFPGGNQTGYDVGGGVEYAFLPNWTVRAEYRYYDFGDSNFTNISNRIAAVHSFAKSDDVIRVGLSYKFGGAEPAAVVAKY